MSPPIDAIYNRCTNAELAKFARDRGISVTSLSRPPRKLLLKRDYFAALKAADANRSFTKFNALPPELRTRVYQEVLILQDSFTCFPQILAISKQVNQEASNILYGDNLIDVRLLADGVYVHGEKVGGHTEDHEGEQTATPELSLVWPVWIRRVQFLRFSLKHSMKPDGSELFPPEEDSKFVPEVVDAVLHSLCSFLASGHRLRSFHISITGERSKELLQLTPHMLHATRFLGRLKEFRFDGDVANRAFDSQEIMCVEDAVEAAFSANKTHAEHFRIALGTFMTAEERSAADSVVSLGDLPFNIKHRLMSTGMAEMLKSVRRCALAHNRFLMDLSAASGLGDFNQLRSFAAAMTEFIKAQMELQAAEFQAIRDEVQADTAIAPQMT